jgi:hypothetical protein
MIGDPITTNLQFNHDIDSSKLPQKDEHGKKKKKK